MPGKGHRVNGSPHDIKVTGDGELALEVEGLTVTLKGQAAIADVSFTVKRGDILTILGPNGAGKTVLLRALLGTLPHAGSIS